MPFNKTMSFFALILSLLKISASAQVPKVFYASLQPYNGNTVVKLPALVNNNNNLLPANIKNAGLQTVIFDPIPQKTVCDTDFYPGATGNGPITYNSSNDSVATIVAGKIHITGPGISIITAADSVSEATDTLTVVAALTPSVTVSPDSISSCPGIPVTYTAIATNGGDNPVYQWQVNGVNSGTNNQDFTASNLSNNDKITCILTSSDSCVTSRTAISNTATFIAAPPDSTSLVIVSSADSAVCMGTQVFFIAEPVTADGNPTYQWEVNNRDEGINSPVFSSSNLTDADVVTCVMTSKGNCVLNTTAISNALSIKLSPARACAIVTSNVITPNGDGINDVWQIIPLQDYTKLYCEIL